MAPRVFTRESFLRHFACEAWVVPGSELPAQYIEESPEIVEIFDKLYYEQGKADAMRSSLPADRHEAYIRGYCLIRGWTFIDGEAEGERA